jgi:hypothetical protein
MSLNTDKVLTTLHAVAAAQAWLCASAHIMALELWCLSGSVLVSSRGTACAQRQRLSRSAAYLGLISHWQVISCIPFLYM